MHGKKYSRRRFRMSVSGATFTIKEVVMSVNKFCRCNIIFMSSFLELKQLRRFRNLDTAMI